MSRSDCWCCEMSSGGEPCPDMLETGKCPAEEYYQEPLDFAPVSAVPVAGFVEVGKGEPIGNFLRFPDGWYYQEDGKPMEWICSVEGRPYPGHFVRRDGYWYYRRDEGEPWEYVGPVDGRAVIL